MPLPIRPIKNNGSAPKTPKDDGEMSLPTLPPEDAPKPKSNRSASSSKKVTPKGNGNVSPKPKPKETAVESESPLPEGWKRDPKTGKNYKELPKTDWDGGEGFSVCHIEEVDALFDLNSAANTYLAHLRVPPSKKELSELRAEKAALAKKQQEEFMEKTKELADKYDSKDDEESF